MDTATIESEPLVSFGNRSIEFLWPIGPATADLFHGSATPHVRLSVFHSADRRIFYAAAHQTTVLADGVTRTSIVLMASRGLGVQEPVARYSDKGLNAFAARALAEHRKAFADGNPVVVNLFTTA